VIQLQKVILNKPHLQKLEIYNTEQQINLSEARPLAASKCCWATSDKVNEHQPPNYILIIKL